jgi:hypothetical protein
MRTGRKLGKRRAEPDERLTNPIGLPRVVRVRQATVAM